MKRAASLAPEHMTDDELWKLIRGRLVALRLALNEGEARSTLVARLAIVEAAAAELERRGAQPSLWSDERPAWDSNRIRTG